MITVRHHGSLATNVSFWELQRSIHRVWPIAALGRLATKDQVQDDLWIIPGELTKTSKVNRLPKMRATFRTWVEETQDVSFEVAEACLEYTVDSGVVRTYQRSDRLKKRRKLLCVWANYLCRD